MSSGKHGVGLIRLFKGHKPAKWRQVDTKPAGRIKLRREKNIGKPRLRTEAECLLLWLIGKQFLAGYQAITVPLPAPDIELRLIAAQFAFQIFEYAKILQWVNVGTYDLGKSFYTGTLVNWLWKKRRVRYGLVKPFDNR